MPHLSAGPDARPAPEQAGTPPGATRVLVLSTLAFTLMFAAWLMFGVLGLPIRDEFGLADLNRQQPVVTAYLLGFLVGQLFTGPFRTACAGGRSCSSASPSMRWPPSPASRCG